MLENPTPPPHPDSATAVAAVKRYAPPNQRKSSLNRRKSGEKNQLHAASKNIPVLDHIDVGSSGLLNENSRPRLVALEGCCRSQVSQILNDRWALAMHNYNDPTIDLSERPVMYSGNSASAWGHFRLPHQFMPPQANSGGPSSGSQMDFLSELRRAIRNASPNSEN